MREIIFLSEATAYQKNLIAKRAAEKQANNEELTPEEKRMLTKRTMKTVEVNGEKTKVRDEDKWNKVKDLDTSADELGQHDAGKGAGKAKASADIIHGAREAIEYDGTRMKNYEGKAFQMDNKLGFFERGLGDQAANLILAGKKIKYGDAAQKKEARKTIKSSQEPHEQLDNVLSASKKIQKVSDNNHEKQLDIEKRENKAEDAAGPEETRTRKVRRDLKKTFKKLGKEAEKATSDTSKDIENIATEHKLLNKDRNYAESRGRKQYIWSRLGTQSFEDDRNNTNQINAARSGILNYDPTAKVQDMSPNNVIGPKK